MTEIPRSYRRFVPQLLHMIILPLFFFTFMLIYRPFGVESFLGREWFAVHLTIISCIILVSAIILRMIFYFVPMRLNYTLYAFWSLAEIVFTSFFVALYTWLVLDKSLPYFEAVGVSLQYLSFVLVFPYVILALSVRIHTYHDQLNQPDEANVQRIRFYDDKHNLKIVLTPDSIMYIASDENYVNITYTDSGKERMYTLRSSMKAIDELCHDNGLVRCHRSYFVNPSFVKVLRKEKEGIIYAEMDSKDMIHIPVSKKYYDHLAELLY